MTRVGSKRHSKKKTHNGAVLSKKYKYLVEVLYSKLKFLGIAVLWYKTPRILIEIYQRF